MRKRFFGSTNPTLPVSVKPDARALVMAAVAFNAEGPRHDPPLEPRDEAVFLLTAAAEIEHALMVQYLFAAYSLKLTDQPALTDEQREQLEALQEQFIEIAGEEMAHLLTVQNLLHLVGGPLNFNREQAPYASEIYPFRFKLEPLTLDALAKYVVAESPREWDAAEKPEIEQRALRSNDGVPVQHVGPIFASLETLFREKLKEADFRLDTLNFQGKPKDWKRRFADMIIHTFDGADWKAMRETAGDAVAAIAQQGEGHDDVANSHFQRFLAGYRIFKQLSADGTRQLTWPIAENPNTTTEPQPSANSASPLEALTEARERRGRITNPRARNWAHLFNLRYRILLTSLSHFLRLEQELTQANGNLTPRGRLKEWTFSEMRWLSRIAAELVAMPLTEPPGLGHAGPPFELPYSLQLPQRETDRWHTHLDIVKAAVALAQRMSESGETDTARRQLLEGILKGDEARKVVLEAIIAGNEPSPLPDPLPADPPGFATEIKGYFRDSDRDAMLGFGFDLHQYEDVRDNADRILTRVADGSMPCDAAGRWPQPRVDRFRLWIEKGKQP